MLCNMMCKFLDLQQFLMRPFDPFLRSVEALHGEYVHGENCSPREHLEDPDSDSEGPPASCGEGFLAGWVNSDGSRAIIVDVIR